MATRWDRIRVLMDKNGIEYKYGMSSGKKWVTLGIDGHRRKYYTYDDLITALEGHIYRPKA